MTTTGLTDFSIFAVANQNAYAPALKIPGPGNLEKECVLEFLLQNPAGAAVLDSNGNTSFQQSCADGDPSCDFDSVANQCTFRAAVCLNVVDANLPSCLSVQAIGLEVKSPSAKNALNPNKPGDDLNRAALLGVSDLDGPLVLPDTRDNDCAPVDLVVPMKVTSGGPKATKKTIKLKASVIQDGADPSKVTKDSDKLKLTCNP